MSAEAAGQNRAMRRWRLSFPAESRKARRNDGCALSLAPPRRRR
ncbi:hypothetical protein [Azospirillum melinis]